MKRNKESLFVHTIIILCCIPCLAAFLLVIAVSFSNETDILRNGYKFIPEHFDLSAYKYIFANPKQVLSAYYVTAVSTVFGTIFAVLMMSMLAYAISRKDFIFKVPFSFLLFFTMLFSGGLVPTYILVTQYLHLNDTIWVFIILGALAPAHVNMLKTFYYTISPSLLDAAKLDGASEMTTLFKIVMPIAKPAIATIALMTALGKWNDWYTCLLYITDDNLLTLQYLLQRMERDVQLLTQGIDNLPAGLEDLVRAPEETIRMAMVVVTTGPMLCVFPFFQKYFTKGIMVGSLK